MLTARPAVKFPACFSSQSEIHSNAYHMINRLLKISKFDTKHIQLSQTFKYFHCVHHVFEETPKPKLAHIHSSMLDHVHQNDYFGVLNVFKRHLQMGLSGIDEVALAIALKSCRGILKLGRQIHGFAVASGLISYVTVSNSLMNMYNKSGNFCHSLHIFERLEKPDKVSYNIMLSGFEDEQGALNFACKLHADGVVFDAVSYTTILAHCADSEEFQLGEQLHCLVLRSGLDCEVFVGNALLTLYAKWGKIIEAEIVFNEIPRKDKVSWNAMLSGYAQEGSYGSEVILAFLQMVRERLKLDHVSLTSVISACAKEKELLFGRQIHNVAFRTGYATDISVCNVLLSMYSKCESVEDVKLIFWSMTDRNVVSWTTMLSIMQEDAVNLFNEMRRDGVYPNEVTFVGLIHSITTNNMVQEGLMVHGYCVKTNFWSNVNVANSFITMYAKFESMEDSLMMFWELADRESISWNALISGSAQNGMYQEALETFFLGLTECEPNEYTFGSVLNAIGSSESISLCHGQCCHGYLIKRGLSNNQITSGALLDMYAKRGSISDSHKVFHEVDQTSQVAWTAIISAHSRHGNFDSVMNLFDEMEKKGVEPDSITFLSVLTACGRKGMVDVGIQVFDSMVKDHSIKPCPEHFSCVIDMLGRSGRLREAEELLDQIPGGPGLSVLQSLLGACRNYGNVDMATRLADILIEMEPEESGSYVLMSNLYAEKGLWEKVAKMRKGMKARGVRKEIGFSWADTGNVDDSLYLHGFSSDDKSHPRTEEIYRMAECLGSEMNYLGEEEKREQCTIDLITFNENH